MKWSSQYERSVTNSALLFPWVTCSYDGLLFGERRDEDAGPVLDEFGSELVEVVVSPFYGEVPVLVLPLDVVDVEAAEVSASELGVLDCDLDARVLFFDELLDLVGLDARLLLFSVNRELRMNSSWSSFGASGSSGYSTPPAVCCGLFRGPCQELPTVLFRTRHEMIYRSCSAITNT